MLCLCYGYVIVMFMLWFHPGPQVHFALLSYKERKLEAWEKVKKKKKKKEKL